MSKNYYDVLGIEKDASADDVKKAFRRKARELHPDVNKADDAEERFKELNEAYDVLSDPQKRANFDRFGSAASSNGFPGGGAGGYQYVDFSDIFGGMGGFADIFSQFYSSGNGRRSTVPREGRDMNVVLTVTLEEVANGAEKEVMYNRLSPCDECGGTGAAEGGVEVACPDCGGTGRVVTAQRTLFGMAQVQSPCSTCQATGKVIDKPCAECEGQGRVPDRERVTIPIPAGVREGQKLRLEGYGEAGMHGAASGDLIVNIAVAEHPDFVREGDNLHVRVKVPMAQAALGAEIELEGILGSIDLSIPEGSQSGDKVKVRGGGLPRYGTDHKGDLIAHIDVVVPKGLSKRQRELLEEFAAESGEQFSEHKGAFQKIKDAIKGS